MSQCEPMLSSIKPNKKIQMNNTEEVISRSQH